MKHRRKPLELIMRTIRYFKLITFDLRAASRTAAALALASLAACGGGGGVQFPADTGAQQNQQTAKAAIDKAAPVLDGISKSFAETGALPASNAQANLAEPSSYASGALRSLEVVSGGAVVASITRAASTAQAKRANLSDDPPATVPVATDGSAKLIWIAFPAGAGVIRWYCFGDYAEVEAETQGVCKFPLGQGGAPALGMTWGSYIGGEPLAGGVAAPDPKTTGVVTVSCNVRNPPTGADRDGNALNACNPYTGDWHVLRRLPVLCVKAGTAPAPAFQVLDWFGGEIAATPPVYGVQLIGREASDALCVQAQGEGWRMASFHDAGGWNISGLGSTPGDTRYWVRIRDQASSAWCGLGTGFSCTSNQ
jgi:predicted small lipoprotein YifL